MLERKMRRSVYSEAIKLIIAYFVGIIVMF